MNIFTIIIISNIIMFHVIIFALNISGTLKSDTAGTRGQLVRCIN